MVEVRPIVVIIQASLSPPGLPFTPAASIEVGDVSASTENIPTLNKNERRTLLNVRVPIKETTKGVNNDDEVVVMENGGEVELGVRIHPPLLPPVPPVLYPDDALVVADEVEISSIRVAGNMCPTCSKILSNSGSLKKHLSVHKEGKFICIECKVNFLNKTTLTKHRVNSHGLKLKRDQTILGKMKMNNNK